jgi:hypothetical protein
MGWGAAMPCGARLSSIWYKLAMLGMLAMGMLSSFTSIEKYFSKRAKVRRNLDRYIE